MASYAVAEGRPVRERRLPCCGIGCGWCLCEGIEMCRNPISRRECLGRESKIAILATIAIILGATKGVIQSSKCEQ
ncbi:Ribosomal protein L18ae family [Prunus dulcis]|uniref:Ribosomal protein L18ae family n=1 Tax=Prunus dulcis TaxID=3755 RepID=A0A4Y1RCI3_PRUDU|nr:Ribosomal protein L18ae family [Prunus dulcis]